MTDSSDEIRGRLSAIIARLEPLAHSTGSLDADDVRSDGAAGWRAPRSRGPLNQGGLLFLC
jgi:hypothetical protein